jgi:hypothetical protein
MAIETAARMAKVAATIAALSGWLRAYSTRTL